MKVVITGITGLLGANVAEQALLQGHEVTGLVRSSSKTDHLRNLPGEPCYRTVDLLDVAQCAQAIAGHDWVIHCAASTSMAKTPDQGTIDANVHATGALIEACKQARISRLVHISSVVCVGVSEDGQTPCTETSTWNLVKWGLDDGYATTKRDAETMVLNAGNDGLDAVIVNPGFLFGRYDSKPSSGEMILQVADGKARFASAGSNSFVSAKAVARGILLAASSGVCGERYIMSGENLSYQEIFARIGTLVGRDARPVVAPASIVRWVGRLGDVVQRFRKQQVPITSTTAAWGNAHNIHDSSKAISELGYDPLDLDEAITDAIDWFKANQRWL